MDFEAATWQALSSVWPDVEKQGCSFHFTQAIMKNVRPNNLARLYNKDAGTRDLIKHVMALCYIPTMFITPRFKSLKEKMHTQELRRIFSKHMVIQQCLDSQGLVSIRRRNKNQQSSGRLAPPFQQYNSENYAFLQFNLNNVRGKYRDRGGRCGYFGRECCGTCQRQACGSQREGATCLGTV
ncbi:uncharacterized protein LOC144422955 isoform X1 [Styela clava]